MSTSTTEIPKQGKCKTTESKPTSVTKKLSEDVISNPKPISLDDRINKFQKL